MATNTEPDGRLTALGNQLIEIHLWLREELAGLRTDLDAYLAGGGDRPEPLRGHCLAFCSALSRHHTGEDGGAFRVLAERFPRLRPVIEELERDHEQVADILRRLADLIGALGAATDPIRVRTELDSLAALLESHFGYEEKKLVAALNALDADAGTAEELLGKR